MDQSPDEDVAAVLTPRRPLPGLPANRLIGQRSAADRGVPDPAERHETPDPVRSSAV